MKIIKGLIITLLLTILISGAGAATLRGTIYEWSNFEEPLKNAIIEVNSTPAQYVVSTSGIYSFNLSPGSYSIKARYYRNNILELATREDIKIDRDGDFIHDLLLFPPTDSEDEYLGDVNLTAEMEIKSENDPTPYALILIVLILFSVALIHWMKKKKPLHEEPALDEKSQPEVISGVGSRELPSDLMELYDLIMKSGGRTTQKDLRKKLAFSEAKVSLMLVDLENRGFIKKIKKGRSNIIIAENQKP